jgi:hypothetical protein
MSMTGMRARATLPSRGVIKGRHECICSRRGSGFAAGIPSAFRKGYAKAMNVRPLAQPRAVVEPASGPRNGTAASKGRRADSSNVPSIDLPSVHHEKRAIGTDSGKQYVAKGTTRQNAHLIEVLFAK